MDALSQVLSTLRMEASILSHFVLAEPWGLHCPTHPGMPFYAVIEGTGWLCPDVGAPLPYLAIGAYGNVDLTIAVHLPDGSWLCNDDWDGLNPRVEGPVGRGRVEVFVGTYGSASQGGGDYEYSVGFSEDPSFMPTMLPLP